VECNTEKNGGFSMKVAIVGSRGLRVDLSLYLPDNVTHIVSGGAEGVDACARNYAMICGLRLTEYLPDYEKFGKAAPIIRNNLIIDDAEYVFAFWDGKSRGTKYIIDRCKKLRKPIKVVVIANNIYYNR
jgi:hypothetical protein